MTDGEYSTQWVNTQKCSRRYVGILPDKDLIREYTDAWVCPDVDEITILNYPSLYQDGSGKSFYVTINDCNKAVEID